MTDNNLFTSGTTERTCVVTGASHGIGSRIAEELGAMEANVVVNYHTSQDAAEDTVDDVEEAGGEAISVQADVSDPDDVLQMYDIVQETFGDTDVLVNNAGLTVDTQFGEMSFDDWQTVVNVNLGGAFNCARTFFDDIRTAEEGRLINISSVVGKQGNYGQANYAASKSGLFGFTRTLALELASHGSTANCVAPGFTRTSMVENMPDEVKDDIRGQIPLDRFAEPDEIAHVVGFLASERASYITGEVLDVTGGYDL